jgi:cell division septum initiation protein DivIVA
MSNERDLIQRMYENVVKDKLFLEEENKSLREEIEKLKNQVEINKKCLLKSSSGVCSRVNQQNSSEDSNDTERSTQQYSS